MSENIPSDTIQRPPSDKDERESSENALWNAEVPSNAEYDKQLFAEKATNTFRELCKTLENEQHKLSELERRRMKLQDDILLLKTEIEEEKKSLNVKIEQSVAEKLSALNNADNLNDKLPDESQTASETLKRNTLYTCHEEEEHQMVTVQEEEEEGTVECALYHQL